MPKLTALVNGIAARLPEENHLAARHLYVSDGDLKAQDATAVEFEQLAKADEAAFPALIKALSAGKTEEVRNSVGEVKELQKAYLGYLDGMRKMLAVSRQETVAEVEDRVQSRTLYTEQLAPAHTKLAGAVAKSSQKALPPSPKARARRRPTR